MEFYTKPSWIEKGEGKYCSLNCSRVGSRTGRCVSCLVCKKSVYRQAHHLNQTKNNNFFCSKQCHLFHLNSKQIGEQASNWKHGQFSYRGKLLRSSVIQECFICKNADKRVLLAHHIDHDRKNNKIENLSWLCSNCHFLVHHYAETEDNFILKLKNEKK